MEACVVAPSVKSGIRSSLGSVRRGVACQEFFIVSAALSTAFFTFPKSVTTPSHVSTLMSSAGVWLSASKRILVAKVIQRSLAVSHTP